MSLNVKAEIFHIAGPSGDHVMNELSLFLHGLCRFEGSDHRTADRPELPARHGEQLRVHRPVLCSLEEVVTNFILAKGSTLTTPDGTVYVLEEMNLEQALEGPDHNKRVGPTHVTFKGMIADHMIQFQDGYYWVRSERSMKKGIVEHIRGRWFMTNEAGWISIEDLNRRGWRVDKPVEYGQ
jgi:hypothetical protein